MAPIKNRQAAYIIAELANLLVTKCTTVVWSPSREGIGLFRTEPSLMSSGFQVILPRVKTVGA